LKTQLSLTEKEVSILSKLLSLDMDRIGFNNPDKKALSKIHSKLKENKSKL
jgi:hypothetical protein